MTPVRLRFSTALCTALCAAITLLCSSSRVVSAHSSASPLASEHTQSYRRFRASLKASMSASEWSAFKAEALTPTAMRGRWLGEDKPGFVKDGRTRPHVDYLHTAAARAPFELTIGKDGRLFSAGKPFDTRGELVNAVVGPDHAIYADTSVAQPTDLNLKHSIFLAGAPSLMALEKSVEAGRLRLATNRSGHYRMSRRDFARGLLYLEGRHVDMDQLEIRFDPKSE